jgi:hypothetical protein
MKRCNVTFLLLLLLAFGTRLIWFFTTDNAGNGDAAARLNVTQIWLYNNCRTPQLDFIKILNPSRDWLPLHFYLVGLVSYIFHDLVYTPRLFTLLISVFTLVPLYKACRLRFNQQTANIAVAILAFYGMHIFLSGLILSETFYIFFLMWCYYFIEKYRIEEHDTKWVILIGLSLVACCLLRYEAWIFAPLVIVIVPFIKKISLKNLLLLLLIPSSAVCFVMLCFVLQGEHPLRGLLFSDFEVKLNNKLTGGPDYTNFLPAYLPAYFIAAAWILVQNIRTKKKADTLIVALYLLPICPFLYKLFNGTLTTQARYLVLYMVPAIVLISGFIYRISQKFRLRNSSLVIFVIAYILLSNISFAHQVYSNNLQLKYAKGFWHSADYFRDSVPQANAYIDYGANMSNSNWMVYANLFDVEKSAAFIDSVAKAEHLNLQVFIDRTKRGAPHRITCREYEWETWSINSFNGMLQKNAITHIVLFPKGPLSQSLNFSNPQEFYFNKRFTRLFTEDGYMIYKIEKDSL